MTQSAYEQTLSTDFYQKNAAAKIGVDQITREPSVLPNGLRIMSYGPKREEIVDMIESILKGQDVEEAIEQTLKDIAI